MLGRRLIVGMLGIRLVNSQVAGPACRQPAYDARKSTPCAAPHTVNGVFYTPDHPIGGKRPRPMGPASHDWGRNATHTGDGDDE